MSLSCDIIDDTTTRFIKLEKEKFFSTANLFLSSYLYIVKHLFMSADIDCTNEKRLICYINFHLIFFIIDFFLMLLNLLYLEKNNFSILLSIMSFENFIFKHFYRYNKVRRIAY